MTTPTPESSGEPRTDAPAGRRFRVDAARPVAATLGELRARIDDLDSRIVALLVERAACVHDATRFKRDAGEVAAPGRQAEVFARVRALAEPHRDVFPTLPDVVEATYRALVAGFVAGEAQLFDLTEPLEPKPE